MTTEERIVSLEEEVMGNVKAGRLSLRAEFSARISRVEKILIGFAVSTIGLLIANLIDRTTP